MTIQNRNEYAKAILDRYLKASRKEKTKILDEFALTTGYHRKHAIRKLRQLALCPKEVKQKAGRRETYGSTVREALLICWKAAGHICGERLQPFLSELVPKLEQYQYLQISKETKKLLLKMSISTVKRIIRKERKLNERSKFSSTKPGQLLKSQIPLQVGSAWDTEQPGFLEIDLVAHCGNSLQGDFINTLNTIDIKTTWSEKEAVMGKSQKRVFAGLMNIRERLPFDLLGIDSDGGSEFINAHLLNFCQKETIAFTRSRPNKKNDAPHIEQKNYSTVRKVFGYSRFDTNQQLNLMNDLYRNELRLFQNFFQPTMKIIEKKRIGSKIIKKYDQAKTPFRRVLECPEVSGERKRRLTKEYDSLDPIKLQQTVEKKIAKIVRLAQRYS